MYLTEETAQELMARCTEIEISRLSFAGCEDVAVLEAHICDGEVVVGKAVNLRDETDVVYVDDPHDILAWMRARFPDNPVVN